MSCSKILVTYQQHQHPEINVGTSHIAPGLVTWLPNRAMQQWRTGYMAAEQCKSNNRKRFYLVGLEPTLKGDTTERAMILLRASSSNIHTRRQATSTDVETKT
jgi:hypothetical protein